MYKLSIYCSTTYTARVFTYSDTDMPKIHFPIRTGGWGGGNQNKDFSQVRVNKQLSEVVNLTPQKSGTLTGFPSKEHMKTLLHE